MALLPADGSTCPGLCGYRFLGMREVCVQALYPLALTEDNSLERKGLLLESMAKSLFELLQGQVPEIVSVSSVETMIKSHGRAG